MHCSSRDDGDPRSRLDPDRREIYSNTPIVRAVDPKQWGIANRCTDSCRTDTCALSTEMVAVAAGVAVAIGTSTCAYVRSYAGKWVTEAVKRRS
jgi:hypothetical protein